MLDSSLYHTLAVGLFSILILWRVIIVGADFFFHLTSVHQFTSEYFAQTCIQPHDGIVLLAWIINTNRIAFRMKTVFTRIDREPKWDKWVGSKVRFLFVIYIVLSQSWCYFCCCCETKMPLKFMCIWCGRMSSSDSSNHKLCTLS